MAYSKTAWVNDSLPAVNAVNLNKIEQGIFDAHAAIAALPASGKVTVSTLAGGPPASPADKDIWIATSVDAIGTRWQFQYSAGSASAFKWEFIGGGGYLAGGASVTVPRAGDYWCQIGAQSSFLQNFLQITAGGVTLYAYADANGSSCFDSDRMNGLSASQVLAWNNAGSGGVTRGYIRIQPVRIS